MANTFSLKVIACDRIFFDGRCTQVVLPLHDGEKAIQAPLQGVSRKSHGASESRQERYADRILMESWFLVIS